MTTQEYWFFGLTTMMFLLGTLIAYGLWVIARNNYETEQIRLEDQSHWLLEASTKTDAHLDRLIQQNESMSLMLETALALIPEDSSLISKNLQSRPTTNVYSIDGSRHLRLKTEEKDFYKYLSNYLSLKEKVVASG